MNLVEFKNRFPDEAACKQYLRVKREEHGITCKRCGSKHHYYIETIEKWECAGCKSRTNLKAGTIMVKSKLPVMYWFIAIHLMTSTKKAISALEMQKQLGHKFYEPIWYMLHKIRMNMGIRDSQYKLKGDIEMDDAFFEVVDEVRRDELGNVIKDDEDKKRGRGSQRQAKVLVMVESKENPLQDNPHKKGRIMGFAKMVVMDNLTSDDINQVVEDSLKYESKVISDGFNGYNKLKHIIRQHTPMAVPAKEAGKKLPWVHTTISNAKRSFLGIHHSIRREYLQNYLNEFCWKLNRRTFHTDLFDRMLMSGVSTEWY
jgi:transposase-like protein